MRQEFGSERQDTLWAIFVFSLSGTKKCEPRIRARPRTRSFEDETDVPDARVASFSFPQITCGCLAESTASSRTDQKIPPPVRARRT